MITIPSTDPSWLRLPDGVRRDAMIWRDLLNAIDQATNKADVIRTLAREHRGFSRKNILGRYYRARRVGWIACVDFARVGHGRCLPALTIEYWIRLCESFQRDRSARRAFTRLREQYRRWAAGDPSSAIPGFKSCPPVAAEGMPRGLTYRSLCRILKARQSKAEALLARRGLAAARPHLPHVPQDVSQVRPLEYVVFDDVEIDFLISVPGSFTPVKLRLLVAMDLCSRVILGFGVRPAIVRPDGVQDSLKLRDAKCIVARTISRWGYPTQYPMTLIVERGTMTLKEGDIAALREISQGQIRVSLTSMICGSVFAFQDRATGNSWGKAWLESFFNYLHNELGDREGQKGRRYDLAPAELHGRGKELAMLMRAGSRLPLALRQQLRMPFPSADEALADLVAAFAKANARTDHDLQGFDSVQEWRLDSAHPWAPIEELPLLADRLGMPLPDLTGKVQWHPRARMESPNERLERKLFAVDRREVSRPALHLLLQEHRLVRFEDFQFGFAYEGKDYVYLPGDALALRLEHSAKYLIWFDPQEMDCVFLTRDFPHRGFLGELTLFRRVRRGDLDEARAALRQTRHLQENAVRMVQSRHPEKFEGAIARARQNVEVLENVAALEVEIDVAAPRSSSSSSSDSPAVRQMSDRLLDRAHAQEASRSQARLDRAEIAALTPAQIAAANTLEEEISNRQSAISNADMSRYFSTPTTEGEEC